MARQAEAEQMAVKFKTKAERDEYVKAHEGPPLVVRSTVICGYCGKPQRGYSTAGDVQLCHPDYPASGEDDCYRMVTVYHRPLLDGRVWPWAEETSC